MSRRIVIRMDDICPRMKKIPFQRMRKLLESYGATAIIGVVPECRDESLNLEEEDPYFWNMISDLQKKGWTIAMHGCFHQYVTNSNGMISNNKRSEFAGLSYDEQYEKLKYGKKKLQDHGIVTDVFMAPSHSYDKNTLLALKNLGFKYITDGLTSKPYTFNDLTFIPCIESKIKKCNRLSTVCYHTNMIMEQRYEETEELLKNNRADVISFSDACKLPRENYAFSRIEEIVRWVWKYKVIGTIYSAVRSR